MHEPEDEIESVEQLANEVTDQVRSGELPSSTELQERYPELSDDVQGLVQTLSILEEASFRRRSSRTRGSVVTPSGQHRKTLGGFRLIREISRGGMGIVYEAEQESLDRRVAVKVLPPSPLLSDVERIRFEREGTAVARLHHSHIVPVFGTGVEDGVQYCVMQYIDGDSLDVLVDQMRQRLGLPSLSSEPGSDTPGRRTEGSSHGVETLMGRNIGRRDHLPDTDAVDASEVRSKCDLPLAYWHNVARIGADVADALHHAHHQGVLHRDIKPGNLLLDREGQVWVTDFGLAKLKHDQDNLTGTGNLVGTMRYAPPEQFDGISDVRSDIYALGLTLYELCTLERAFGATDQRELMREVMTGSPVRPDAINPAIPRDLETIILKATSTEPSHRYQSAGDLADDLENYLEDRPLNARRLSVLEKGYRWCRQHKLETALGSFAIGMLFVSLIMATVAYVRESRLRLHSEATAARTRQALDRVYDSYLPDWTNYSTVSAHGQVSVSPASAQLLEELVEFYEDLAKGSHQSNESAAVIESAAAMRRVGLIYHRLGEFGRAKKSYSKAKRRLNDYYRQSPSDDVQLEYARVCNELGSVNWTERRFSEAYQCHAGALEILELISTDSDNRDAVDFELARTLYLFGRRGRGLAGGIVTIAFDPGRTTQDVSAAKRLNRAAMIQRATVILEDLMDGDPGNLEFRHLIALCYREQASRQVDERGMPVDPAMDKALEAFEDLIYFEPENPSYRYDLCVTLQWILLGAEPTKEACDAAVERLHRSIKLADDLSQRRPDEWIYMATRVQALLKLANVQNKGDRLDDALSTIGRAVELANGLSDKYPESDMFKYWYAFALRRSGDLMYGASDFQSAIDSYNQAATAYEGLKENERLGMSVERNLEKTLNGLAQALHADGQSELGEKDIE